MGVDTKMPQQLNFIKKYKLPENKWVVPKKNIFHFLRF